MPEQSSLMAEPEQPAELIPEPRNPEATKSLPVTHEGRLAWTPILLVATAIVLGSGLWILSHQLAPQITTPVSSESAYVASFPEKSIAVLPFEDLGEGEKDSLLADSVQDDILTALAKIADLRVISRTSVSSYTAGQRRNLREIAQSLGAGHILEGNVSRAGERVRIAVQLTDARRGARLWAMSYERKMGAVSKMQSELVLRIAAQLQAEVSSKEKAALDERPTEDLVAYGFYVRGKTLVASVANAQINEKLLQAVQALDQAIARDPNFYLAWCQLAAAHDYIYFFGFDRTPARLALAEAALGMAIRLRSDAGETHLAKANFLYRCHLDYDTARAELALTERALPNNSEAFELTGYIDRRQGLWPESARSLQRALKLDPRNAFLLQQIAASYQEFRQFGAMAAALDRALAIAPADLDSRVTRAFVDLEWRADTQPLHRTIDALLAENPQSASDLADQWLYVSLCERDHARAERAVAALPATGISTDLNFPRSYCAALAARARGDAATAQAAFLAARAEVEKTAREQPDYGPVFTVLGLIDAGLGRKEEAMREGRRGVELLPITKNSIDGGELMKYLGVIYTWCGEKDLALEQIEATLRIPSSLSYGNLKLHPYWDALRGEPRFEKIVADLAPKN
jgi:TolB-like protein/Tfp pilus assembly protein PilF